MSDLEKERTLFGGSPKLVMMTSMFLKDIKGYASEHYADLHIGMT